MRLFILISALLVPLIGYSQSKWQIGLNAGPDYDKYQYDDPGGQLVQNNILSGHIGIEIEKKAFKEWSIGSGIILKPFTDRKQYKGEPFSTTTRAFNSLMLPVYGKWIKKIPNEPFSFFLRGGIACVYNLDFWTTEKNDWYGESSINTTLGDNITDRYFGDANIQRIFFLAQIGGGVQLHVSEKWSFGLTVMRAFGFTEVVRIEVDYTVNNNASYNATLTNKGQHISAGLHLFRSF